MYFFISLSFLSVIVTAVYAPQLTDCPGRSLVREAKGISSQEAEWVKERQKITTENLKRFLETAGLENFDAETFFSHSDDSHPISIGLAFSGGGYRAMLCGAGFLSALDNRTRGAYDNGLGGLLQASTYMSGLSGGSWLVGSLVANNFTSVQDIIDGRTQTWDLSYSIWDVKSAGVLNLLVFYLQLAADAFLKKLAGFQITFTDLWGRALSHHFFGGDNYGDSIVWSDVQNMQAFVNHEMPLPIIVANSRTPGQSKVDENSAIIEISPFELGSWDPALNSFVETRYLGTTFDNGVIAENKCYRGFDNTGFVLATSSKYFSVDHSVAAYKPNPFKNVRSAQSKKLVDDDTLALVDGGEDGQNVPLYPLVQKYRGVDLVFAYDSSSDTPEDWPNGKAMNIAYLRSQGPQGKTMMLPKIPDSDTFIKAGLTGKPVFFGCDAYDSLVPASQNGTWSIPEKYTNKTQDTGIYSSQGRQVPPLIIYVANRKLSFDSNKSTFTFVYDDQAKFGMIRNGFEVASRNNRTEDSAWKTCVSCAIIKREQDRRGVQPSEQCQKCFQKYCWNK